MHFLIESPPDLSRARIQGKEGQTRRFVDPDNRWVVTASLGGDAESGWLTDTRRHLLMILGEPVVDEDVWLNLQSQVASVPESFAQTLNFASTAAARAVGTFTIILVDKTRPAFHLIGDPLGVRPFYWAVHAGVLAISSQRECVASRIGASTDEVGVIERLAFGVPLCDRTVHSHVHRSGCGQRLELTLDGSANSSLHFPSAAATPATIDDAADELAARFEAAMTSRYAPATHALTTLSGGLDSRVVLASLLDRGMKPDCLSFGATTSLDRQLALDFARHTAVPFHGHEFPHARRISWAMRIRTAAAEIGYSAERLVSWSGDGGSVCIGGVYLNRELVARFDSRDRAQIARDLLNLYPLHIPSLLFSSREEQDIRETVLTDLTQTLVDAEVAQVLNPFRWLVQEDQRRHLDDHFEGEPSHRVHFLLPFFDRRVIEFMMGVPIEWIMHHHLYMRWVRAHLPKVVQTPWQAYPEHEPCELPLPRGIYQWSREAGDRNRRVNDSLGRADLLRWMSAGCQAPTLRRRLGTLAAAIIGELRMRRGDATRMLASDLAFPNTMGGY